MHHFFTPKVCEMIDQSYGLMHHPSGDQPSTPSQIENLCVHDQALLASVRRTDRSSAPSQIEDLCVHDQALLASSCP